MYIYSVCVWVWTAGWATSINIFFIWASNPRNGWNQFMNMWVHPWLDRCRWPVPMSFDTHMPRAAKKKFKHEKGGWVSNWTILEYFNLHSKFETRYCNLRVLNWKSSQHPPIWLKNFRNFSSPQITPVGESPSGRFRNVLTHLPSHCRNLIPSHRETAAPHPRMDATELGCPEDTRSSKIRPGQRTGWQQ